MASSYIDVMSEFSQSNAKIMATALFFEYIVYCVFAFADGYFKSGPEYIYVNEKMAAMMKEKAAKSAQEKTAKSAQAKAAKEAQKKQNNDQKANKKEDKKNDKKEDKKDNKGPNVQKEGGEIEYDGGDEERGRVNTGPKASSKNPEIPGNQREIPPVNARDRTPSNREMGREIDRRAAHDPALDEVGYDYLKWSKKNHDSISKIIVTTFPKYFLFFAFCVGYCASRAPTDFAVGLTYSMVLVRIVHVYAYYYYNQILIIGCVGFGAAINIILIFTALINKY